MQLDKHDSSLSYLKTHWLESLTILDELVGENTLPESFRKEIDTLREAINTFQLKVPLIGKFSVGKSTLVNCWLGRDIQKDDLGACTTLATEFHYAPPGKEKLVIHWLDGAPVLEERPVASYPILLDSLHEAARLPLFIELHLNHSTLAHHPDLILVDTPGFGSSNGEHERALLQYIGEGVACILCVTRISQVGIDELDFINRQRSLGQDFSLLVCQEALNTPNQREELRQQLAKQAGLEADQLIRGCSAREGDLDGFTDLLAHLEMRKAALFQQQLAPQVMAVCEQAKRLIHQQLTQDTTHDELLTQRQKIQHSQTQLKQNYDSEKDSLLRDCRGSITRQVLATVTSYLHSRRGIYTQRLLNGQSIDPLLSADTGNACQLAVEHSLTPRLEEACQNLGKAIDLNIFEGPLLASSGADGLGPAAESKGAGMATGAAIGTVIGAKIPIIGSKIGAVIGGAIGQFVDSLWSRSNRESEAEGRAHEAIESMFIQVQSVLPGQLQEHARQFLQCMYEDINTQLDALTENINHIDEQLKANEQQKKQIRERSEQALNQISKLVL